ncbi:hypothetical protein B0H21DRAFT_713139 [Amylocystis lapponica]|nr:hypothetical protein B0H21DRAFT_713139 [Amylocystis lapponica]
MDTCPADIQDPFMRQAWISLSPEARMELLRVVRGARQAPAGTATASNNWLEPSGMQAPHGEPYPPPQVPQLGAPPPQPLPDPAASREPGSKPPTGGRHSTAPLPTHIAPDAFASHLFTINQTMNMMQAQLQATNARMEDVLAQNEAQKTAAAPPEPSVNTRGGRIGVYAARGGGPAAKRRRIQAPHDQENTAPEDVEADDAVPVINIGKAPLSSLTSDQQELRHEIGKMVRHHIRRLTGVGIKDKWPKWTDPMPERLEPETGNRYLDPYFESDMRHVNNITIVERTVGMVWIELNDENTAPDFMEKQPKGIVTRRAVRDIARTAWRGFKEAYKAQHYEDHKDKQERAHRKTRRYLRRKNKCTHLLAAIDTYMERHGVNPTNLVAIDLMSDEGSGPEDEGEEPSEWQSRMAKAVGMSDVQESVLQGLVFFERIKPNWRSDEYTAILHELLTVKQRKEYHVRVTSTGRSTNMPPPEVPYNFGINKTWFEEHKAQYADYLRDWYQFPDPPGFGSNHTNPDSEGSGSPSNSCARSLSPSNSDGLDYEDTAAPLT